MRELNVNEIEQVNGGFISSAIKAAVKYLKSKQAARIATVGEVSSELKGSTDSENP